MRRLDDQFMGDLGPDGFLHPLLEAVQRDRDLSLEIRDNYFNVYFRGYSVAKVDRDNAGNYPNTLHNKFCPAELGPPDSRAVQPDEIQLAEREEAGPEVGGPAETTYNVFYWKSREQVEHFVKWLPFVKQRALELKNYADELEVEQWLMRAGSREAFFTPSCNVEYFAIDRQAFTPQNAGRIDVLGFFWKWSKGRRGGTVPLAVIEIKHLLNNEIQVVHDQLWRYREWVSNPEHLAGLAEDLEGIARQKVQLGLLRPEIAALQVDRNPRTIKYVVILVDYNPNSELLPRLKSSLATRYLEGGDWQLFVEQLELFHLGFAMWRRYGQSGEDIVLG